MALLTAETKLKQAKQVNKPVDLKALMINPQKCSDFPRHFFY